MEKFKDIEGYEGYYQVSNLGRVKSLDRVVENRNSIKKVYSRMLSMHNDGHGYLIVSLAKDKKQKTFKVHSLVAMMFLNHKPDGNKIVVDHINNISTDNRLENLQIITHRENLTKDKVGGTSKYPGVDFNYGKWRARIRINNKRKIIGRFDNELEAGEAYQKELNKLNNYEH